MKSSNLAERLEEFEAVMDSLRLTSERTVRMDVRLEANSDVGSVASELQARPRRAFRAGSIVNRDQGLRAFKIF
jgi:hypothetical protein